MFYDKKLISFNWKKFKGGKMQLLKSRKRKPKNDHDKKKIVSSLLNDTHFIQLKEM